VGSGANRLVIVDRDDVVIARGRLLVAISDRVGADAIVGTGLAAESALGTAAIDERTAARVARDVLAVALWNIDLAARHPPGAPRDPDLEPPAVRGQDRHRLARLDLEDHRRLLAGAAVDLGALVRLHLLGARHPRPGQRAEDERDHEADEP